MNFMIINVTLAVWLFGLAVGQQASDIPASGWLTAAAGVIGIVAIAQAVRAISRTEAQKTQLLDAQQRQLEAAYAEIRELHELIVKLEENHE